MSLRTLFWPCPGVLVLAGALALVAGSPALAQQSSAQAQDQGEKPKPKKVWTDADLKAPPKAAAHQATPNAISPPAAANGTIPGTDGAAENDGRQHYTRNRDPKWYARELQPLREALANPVLRSSRFGEGGYATPGIDRADRRHVSVRANVPAAYGRTCPCRWRSLPGRTHGMQHVRMFARWRICGCVAV